MYFLFFFFFILTQQKNLLFLCFDLFCRFFGIFFFLPFLPPSVVVVDFIGTWKSIQLLSIFFFSLFFLSLFFFFWSVTFFIVVTNLCLYIGLFQFWGVFLLLFSFFLILIFNFLNLLLFSLHLFLYLLFLLFFSSCS